MDVKFKYIGKNSPRELSITVVWNKKEQLAYVKDVSGPREMKDFLRNEMIDFPDSLDIILGEVFKFTGIVLQHYMDELSLWIKKINSSRPPNFPG